MKLRSMVDQPEGNNTAISETKGPRENRSKILFHFSAVVMINVLCCMLFVLS